jgi:hypothetical protein
MVSSPAAFSSEEQDSYIRKRIYRWAKSNTQSAYCGAVHRPVGIGARCWDPAKIISLLLRQLFNPSLPEYYSRPDGIARM